MRKPAKKSLESLSDRDLLRTYVEVMELLRARKVVRSSNNPCADYAETLVARALGLTLAVKSRKSFDGVDRRGRRIEIKSRRVTAHNPSRQLSAIRGLPDRGFDLLAAVLFRPDFSVWKACLIPHAQVESASTFVARTNSWRFLLRDSVWHLQGVKDITKRIQEAQE